MKPNPKLYRQLSEPFADSDAASKAAKDFADEMAELRIKHKMPDVVVIISVNYLNKDGDEGEIQCTLSLGDINNKLMMLAHALGEEKQRQRDLIALMTKRDEFKLQD